MLATVLATFRLSPAGSHVNRGDAVELAYAQHNPQGSSSSLALTLLFAGCSASDRELVDEPTHKTTRPSRPNRRPRTDTGDSEQGAAKFNQTYIYESGAEISIIKIQKRPDAVIFTIKIANKTQGS